jgi:hypothetical protein
MPGYGRQRALRSRKKLGVWFDRRLVEVKWLGWCWLAVAALLATSPARAEGDARWQVGPPLDLGARDLTLLLGDGRVFTCHRAVAPSETGPRCEVIEPFSGERRQVAAPGRDWRFEGTVALDDGRLLLPDARVVYEAETGAVWAFPEPAPKLGGLRGEPIPGGRALFRKPFVDPNDPGCARLVLFRGREQGFSELSAGPAGTCVEGVHDLGDGRLLVARWIRSETLAKQRRDFLLLDLADLSWKRGAEMTERAFRAQRFAGDELVLFDDRGAVLWDPTRGTETAVPLPAPEVNNRQVVVRRDELVLFAHAKGRAFLLSRKLPPPATPCDDVFAYAEIVMARKTSDAFRLEQLDALLPRAVRDACRRHLEHHGRFPPSLQEPIDALMRPRTHWATHDEDVASRVLCALMPRWSRSMVVTLVRRGQLGYTARAFCRESLEQLPVLDAAEKPGGAAQPLAKAGVQVWGGRPMLAPWVVRLLRSRDDIARSAGPLLREAQRRRAAGFDALRALVCTPRPRAGLAGACSESSPSEEQSWHDMHKLRRSAIALGIATALAGGLGTLAYVDREGDGARAIAIGSGIVAGGALGAVIPLALAEGGDSEGLGAMLLAIPLSVLGGVAGGVLSAKAAEKPGDTRFVSAVVPLSALYLTTVWLTAAAW